MAPACNCMYNDERCCRWGRRSQELDERFSRTPWVPSYRAPNVTTTADQIHFKPEETTTGIQDVVNNLQIVQKSLIEIEALCKSEELPIPTEQVETIIRAVVEMGRLVNSSDSTGV